MPKRKRDDVEDQRSRIEDRAVRIKASRLQAKLGQSNKLLKDAVQLARGFERQKLSRRQKQAEQHPHTLLRLREEVIVVKELDPTKTAKDYLFKQLVKTKKIKESPAFVALFGDDPQFEPSKSSAEGNVLGRLFKSNPVKEVLPDILKGIRDIVGADQPGGPVISEQQHVNEEEFTGFSDDDRTVSNQARDKLLDDLDLDVISENESEAGGSQQDFSKYDDRLGASSDESLDGDDYADDVISSGATKRILTPSPSGSSEPDIPSNKKRAPPEKPTQTAFLPSLSMGGYYSGSESDGEDGFDPDGNSNTAQQRKNRRGQRARQMIAAKKYGNNAKHLIKEREDNSKKARSRDAGWDPRKGAIDGSKDKRFTRGMKGGRYSSGITGANGDAVNIDKARDRQAGRTANKKSDGPLHPSWEAARKKKIESNNASFAGKKITFD